MLKNKKILSLIISFILIIFAICLIVLILNRPSYDPDEFKDGEPRDIIEVDYPEE